MLQIAGYVVVTALWMLIYFGFRATLPELMADVEGEDD